MRGIRGATSVERDTPEEVLAATAEMLRELLDRNAITDLGRIASAFFTTTPDLTSCFPAEAARRLGMGTVPLLCASEIAVPGSLPRCVRVLLHVDLDVPPEQVCHVYLREATRLRPDLRSAQ